MYWWIKEADGLEQSREITTVASDATCDILSFVVDEPSKS